jgi:hypothetical protein
MNNQSINELEDTLHAGETEVLDTEKLAAIRRRGGRRRTALRAVSAVGTASVVGAVALTLALTGAIGSGGDDAPTVAADPPAAATPKELSPLAARTLQEIPGATQVSAWQVVVPTPGAASEYWMGDILDEDADVVGATVPLDARSYQGVTGFPKRAWPAWLYQGTLAYEQSQQDENGGVPVGSTDTGVLVDVGDAELACVSWQGNTCGPALLTRTADGELHYDWGMGTDDFLKPGSDMEVFVSDDYSTGSAGTLVFAGLPGTDVARVDFVTTTGEVVAGQVTTTLVEGGSMMSARVPGEVAKVVAYDAAGEVIEDHPLRACDDPVDCEVR